MESPKHRDKAIRKQYEQLGVEAYYKQYGALYENPHFPFVRQLLIQNQERINYQKALDFCCGGGEVALVLQELGFPDTVGCDPFTQAAFYKNLGRKALSYSFEEVIRGQLSGSWTSIICSFAMHLCPEKQLYPLVFQLFQCSPQLVILTPHKRPQLEKLDGVRLELTDFCFTPKGKKVFLKSYRWGVDSSISS
ncbi:MAG: hypothetical protein AAF985_21335 [Bacteroidota bacterium]